MYYNVLQGSALQITALIFYPKAYLKILKKSSGDKISVNAYAL